MTNATVETRRIGWNVYYGWVVLSVAALAMVGTLPGRTQGLGLITEPGDAAWRIEELPLDADDLADWLELRERPFRLCPLPHHASVWFERS